MLCQFFMESGEDTQVRVLWCTSKSSSVILLYPEPRLLHMKHVRLLCRLIAERAGTLVWKRWYSVLNLCLIRRRFLARFER